MYPFDDENEQDFYSRDYSSSRRKSVSFDPFGDIDTDITGVTKKFGSDGKFIESEDVQRRKQLFAGEPRATKTETELAPMVEGSEYADDYSWWRKEKGYREWLGSQNLDPDKLDSFTGNKLFTEYIKFKAENPEGFMKFSSDVMGAVGGVIQGVSDTLSKIPGIKTVAKPVGSILQFIGNLADLPRNVLAGAFTALSTNNPDEILPNMWEALKFSVGEVVGNEGTGKDVGRYFSWMDGQLMNLVEKTKQGMSDKEYKDYIDSDSFRQTKRLWQTGGMLLDLVVDPSWFIGAGEAKALKAMKELNLGKSFVSDLLGRITEIKKGGMATAVEKSASFEIVSDMMNKFTTKSEKLVDFIKADKGFLKTLGMDTFDFQKSGLVETVNELTGKFNDLAAGDLKRFEYSMRLKIPYVNRQLGGMKIGPAMPGMANLAEKVIGKMSGQPNPILSIAGRSPERAATKINLFSDYNRAIYEGGNDFGKVLDDLAKNSDVEIRTAALELKKNPDLYNDMLSAVLESNTTSAPFAFIDVPGAEQATKRSLFAVNEPLFKEILTHPAIEKLRSDMDSVFKNTYEKVRKSTEKNLQLARMFGMTDELGHSIGLTENELQELFIQGYKKTPKEKLSFGEAVGKFRDEAKDMARLGDEAGKPYEKIAGEIENEYTKYYYHELTDEAIKYITDLKRKSGVADDPIKIGQMMPDPTRKVYIATDLYNTTLQDIVFGPNKAMEFRKLLEETPNAAILKMNTGLRELLVNEPEKFKQLTQWSNILDSKGVPIKMNDLSTVSNVGKDIRPLIAQGSVSLLNEYSRKGLLFDGFQGTFYKGGFEPIYAKVLRDQKIIERLESVNMVLTEGQKGGWLKKLKNESDLINYDKTWKYQPEGIFKGFIVKDYLEKPLDAAVRGMLGIAEHLDDTSPWIVKRGKELLNSFASWWKVNVFIKNPGAQPRNFMANRVMMNGIGISPGNIFSKEAHEGRKVWKYYRAAEKYQESIFSGKNTAQMKARMIQLGAEKVSYEGTKISIMEATEKLMQQNVIGSGFINSMMDKLHATDDATEYEKFRKLATESNKSFVRKWNPLLYFFGKNDEYAKTFKNFGGLVENAYGRLETFFTLTGKQGMSASEAAIKVNETLIDYGRIGRTEDAIRRYMIPFYTWQSRMIPIMLQKAIEQPAFFTKITQLKNNAYSILELDKNFAPRGEEVMEGIPSVSLNPTNVGKFFKGKPMNEIKTQYFSGEGWLPQAVINLFEPSKLKNLIAPDRIEEWAPLETLTNIGKGAMEYVVGGASPMLKLPVESLTGYSFQFKRMLQAYPDQTTEFLGMHMAPKRVNILRSVFGTLREVDDVISIWDKNAITGQPKYTAYDILWKNLIGYRPYNRNEIREVSGALGELKQIYQSNLSDSRKMVYDPPQAQKHAKNALMAYHGIKALEWYKDFLTEVRDKEATARGIQLDIADIEERLQNPRLNKKQVQKYEEKKMSLYERLEAFIADQEKI
jgi:hypothetical protein